MKFTSIFFKTNGSIFKFYLKDNNKRVKKTELAFSYYSMRIYLAIT